MDLISKGGVEGELLSCVEMSLLSWVARAEGGGRHGHEGAQ